MFPGPRSAIAVYFQVHFNLRLTALKLRRTLTSGNLGIARDFFSSIQNRVTCFNSQWMLRNIILTAYQ
jgi:hypothetical protein